MQDLGDGFVLKEFLPQDITLESLPAMGRLMDALTDGKRKSVTAHICHALQQKNFYISSIFKNGVLVGMACVHCHIARSGGLIAYVDDVVVAPEAQGRGLSRHLMNDLKRQASLWLSQYILLTSNPARVTANNLYQKLGYVLQENTSAFRISVPKRKSPILCFSKSKTPAECAVASTPYVHSIRTLTGRKAFVDPVTFEAIRTEAIPGELLAAAMHLGAEELNVFAPNTFDGTQLTELGFEKRDTNIYLLTL